MPCLPSRRPGRIQGKVVDDKDAAVAGAQILVTAIPDQGGQKWQATSDKNGNYIIGTLPKSGQYLVVASKEGVGEDEARAAVKIGNFTTTNFKLSRAARVSEEQAKKNSEIKKFFEAGVAAAKAGNHQAAVEAFTNAGVGDADLRRLLLQRRRVAAAAEEQRSRGSGLQEGDRAAPELPRGLQRAGRALHRRTRRWTSRRRPRRSRRS